MQNQMQNQMQSQMQSCTQSLDRTTARKTRSAVYRCRGYGQSKSRIKPESRYQYVTVTESKHSNVVKLEPAAGPTLFLIRTTTDRSTTVAAIRIQYCASCTTRTDAAARKGPVQRQQHDIGEQAPRNGKAVYKEALQDKRRQRCSARDRT